MSEDIELVISVSQETEILTEEQVNDLVEHTLFLVSSSEKGRMVICQEYQTNKGVFATFVELSPEGIPQKLHLGTVIEISEVKKEFEKRARDRGLKIKSQLSPKTRAKIRKNKRKKDKKTRKLR